VVVIVRSRRVRRGVASRCRGGRRVTRHLVGSFIQAVAPDPLGPAARSTPALPSYAPNPGCATTSAAAGAPSSHTGEPPTRKTGERPTGSSMTLAAPSVSLSLRSEEHTSELQSRENLVCRLL